MNFLDPILNAVAGHISQKLHFLPRPVRWGLPAVLVAITLALLPQGIAAIIGGVLVIMLGLWWWTGHRPGNTGNQPPQTPASPVAPVHHRDPRTAAPIAPTAAKPITHASTQQRDPAEDWETIDDLKTPDQLAVIELERKATNHDLVSTSPLIRVRINALLPPDDKSDAALAKAYRQAQKTLKLSDAEMREALPRHVFDQLEWQDTREFRARIVEHITKEGLAASLAHAPDWGEKRAAERLEKEGEDYELRAYQFDILQEKQELEAKIAREQLQAERDGPSAEELLQQIMARKEEIERLAAAQAALEQAPALDSLDARIDAAFRGGTAAMEAKMLASKILKADTALEVRELAGTRGVDLTNIPDRDLLYRQDKEALLCKNANILGADGLKGTTQFGVDDPDRLNARAIMSSGVPAQQIEAEVDISKTEFADEYAAILKMQEELCDELGITPEQIPQFLKDLEEQQKEAERAQADLDRLNAQSRDMGPSR